MFRNGTRSGAAREGAMKYVLISAGLTGLYFLLARTGNATAARCSPPAPA